MKKIKLIITTAVFLLSFSIYSQEANPNTILGFACGGTGSSTKSVGKVYNYVIENKYSKITKLLYSKNTAEKFLAVIVCEKLAEKQKIKLAPKDLNQIKELYISDEFVYVCSGCTFEGNLNMAELLNGKDTEYTRKEAEDYFKDIL